MSFDNELRLQSNLYRAKDEIDLLRLELKVARDARDKETRRVKKARHFLACAYLVLTRGHVYSPQFHELTRANLPDKIRDFLKETKQC